MSIITDKKDLKKLRRAGGILADILKNSHHKVTIGTNLLEIDAWIENEIISHNCKPSFKGFEKFPDATCLSVNHEVVHSIPKDYVLKRGDVLGVDVGLWLDSVCVDSAYTIAVGEVNKDITKLLKLTQKALDQSIKIIKPGIHTGNIGHTISGIAQKNNLGVITALSGHGVGYKVHDSPSIPNFGDEGKGEVLEKNMVIAIEPMFTLGKGDVATSNNGWDVTTADNSIAAQFEHTVLVTENGHEVIT